jgi:hypothetical protein
VTLISTIVTCPGDCSKHGECRSLKYHAFRKDKGDGSPVRYDSNWDSEMIYGCVCDEGYEGGDCSRSKGFVFEKLSL